MNDGINLIRYIFTKFLDIIFNRFLIVNDVSLGWIVVTLIIFSILISNVLSVAKNSINYNSDKSLYRENKKVQTQWYKNHMGD